jgi:tRNA1(Val) A37 N6-methylase TrmN6
MSCLYFSTINSFKPIRAIEIYKKYNARDVLDFTAGWGGRLVGACACDVRSYTGIDLNKNLKPLYNKMIKFLNPLTKTKINMIFEDSLNIDYSKISYNFVLTSPPYFTLETYRCSNLYESNDDMILNFYEPLIRETYKFLQCDGYYCININKEIYNIFERIIGRQYDERIPFIKNNRTNKDSYHEYIYVWKK